MRTWRTAALVMGAVGLTVAALTVAQPESGPDRAVSEVTRRLDPRRITPPTPSEPALANHVGGGGGGAVPAARYPFEFRTIDGVGNNPNHPERGAAGIAFLREVPAVYGGAGDGAVPARTDHASARAISNAMCEQLFEMPNAEGISDYLWQWGQFVDHDIDETPLATGPEEFDIEVPMGDEFFDPFNTGTEVIPMDRSAYFTIDGQREQVNLITSFIDASNVYGSEHSRAQELRMLDGTGRMKTSAGNLLPYNENGFPNANGLGAPDESLFLAGDVRCNEQAGLTAMHTLFVREHNYWATAIHTLRPGLSGDEVYERARAIVAAELQAITYNEFLPLLLGDDAIPAYDGYKADVDPGISNMFANAAYRVGHTMLSPRIMRLDDTMQEAPEGHLPLRNAFFTPAQVENHGITSMLRGLSGQASQMIDSIVIDDVRNFLFGMPGMGGFDLASLNIQRGRDHGLGSYNDVREAYGMARAASFADINPDPTVRAAFASVYTDVDQVDPWVGLLAEPHVVNAQVGETLWRVLSDQFTRLRDGDRFWYEAYLPRRMVRMVNRQTLGTIIRRNTDAGLELDRDVFKVIQPIDPDWDGDGNVDFADLIAFTADFRDGDADANGDGTTDFEDVLDFLAVWGAAI